MYLWIVGLLALACIPVDFQLFREVRKTQEADILRERVRMLESKSGCKWPIASALRPIWRTS
ncbi:MAG: hypothetical protein ACLSDQ_12835 [Adlercreutzia equolifaciens]